MFASNAGRPSLLLIPTTNFVVQTVELNGTSITTKF